MEVEKEKSGKVRKQNKSYREFVGCGESIVFGWWEFRRIGRVWKLGRSRRFIIDQRYGVSCRKEFRVVGEGEQEEMKSIGKK